MRPLLLIALLPAIAPCMNAQRMVSAPARFAPNFNHVAHPRSSLYPLAFFDPFYSDYLSTTGYPVASQPPVVILQTPPTAASVPEPSSMPSQSPTEPLMIELRGDRYVRVSSDETSGTQMIDSRRIDPLPDPRHREQHSPGPALRAVPAEEMVPAVLVFRDGHREEVSDYTIADGVLYAHSDYFTTGSWNRKIELSSLNLPETITSNQSRGIKFQLPAAPNEVEVTFGP